jgi:predicted nucleotidyltransferase
VPNGAIDSETDYVAKLAIDSEIQWPTIVAAQKDAFAVRQLLHEKLRSFTSADVDIVVFGSLARREWTSGSDVDWTLLIDGQASTAHRVATHEVEQALKELKYKGTPLQGPGREGIFGKMAFSHEIVHHIGGQADTNRNTTQRILLLLEAAPLRDPKDELDGPCERTIRQVLNRYLVSDSNFHSQSDQRSRIPRFLLNDIVRYWRTMCVDFAYKDWEQAGRNWAVRNIKLRTSRKVLFVAGLLTVFSCLDNDELRRDANDSEGYPLKLQAHLLNFAHSTPLNIVVWALGSIGLNDRCVELLGIYEQFLAAMNDGKTRAQLEGLKEKAVYEDGMFLKCREISHQLQAVLRKVCFEDASPLREFICEYGVF